MTKTLWHTSNSITATRMLLVIGMVAVGFVVCLAQDDLQKEKEIERRKASSGKLTKLWTAMHDHYLIYKKFLAQQAAEYPRGSKGLSWRVHLLPFLNEQKLYEKFRLDEPWDSEHNKKLTGLMPECYRAPNSTHKNKTTYLAPIIKDSPFSLGRTFTWVDMTSGSWNTIMFVEAVEEKAVVWTQPEDFEVDEKNPFKGLAGSSDSGFLVISCQGDVCFIDETSSPQMLLAHFTLSREDDEKMFQAGTKSLLAPLRKVRR
jgi:hypothetical protein